MNEENNNTQHNNSLYILRKYAKKIGLKEIQTFWFSLIKYQFEGSNLIALATLSNDFAHVAELRTFWVVGV